jgi:hypothetical protein
MVFKPELADNFASYVRTIVDNIAKMPGCHKVYVLRDVNKPNVFFTYSFWDSENYLENYRHSELFRDVWSETKKMFSERAEAWSTEVCCESENL